MTAVLLKLDLFCEERMNIEGTREHSADENIQT
jgi:hypothetical protein